MQILPLSEGSFTIDKTKLLVPFNEETDKLQERPKGSLLVEIQPFCINTGKDIILIDTGLGYKKDRELQVHANLEANGIDPNDITKVLMSHLHKDHAGAVSFMDRLGNYHLSFPNAVYFVQRREFDYAMDKAMPSYMPDEIEILDSTDKVFWLHEDEGTIDNFIRYQVTGAHSPYHQVFWLEMDGETVFYGGDDAPQYNQMMSRFVAKYDYDGKKCMELRQQWWQEGQEKKWKFLFYHDVNHCVVTP